ncbi:MAG: type II toxin-antitoxin system HicB family antitoxin [Ruminococcus sp.]|jgi:predicted RNase H-like HicB family nuclease|nr:type II toxin-antitoxin system HicB family antitoxin [Ruminococcus sp.]
MRYTYPAVFHPAKEGGYWIEFPDLPDCFSQGETIDECMIMSADAASIWLCNREDNRLPAVTPSTRYKSENPEDIVTLISVDTNAYRAANDNRIIKKTLTIPNWLNEKALDAHLNFSSVLQEGIKRSLGLI